MEVIKTNTGKQFDCDYVSVVPAVRTAYIRVQNTDIATVATVFGDTAETSALLWGDIRIEGYTRLAAIIPEGKTIRINLKEE